MASKFMASKFMAPKFMANAAFEARLLLRPSHQRTVWTVNKLKCPILSSRSYSDSASTPTPPSPESSGSTSTPPLPKSFGSTSAPPLPKSSGSTSAPPFPQSSGSTFTPPFPNSSSSTEGSQSSGPKVWVSILATSFITASISGLINYYSRSAEHASNSKWEEQHRESQRHEHESARESAIYDQLKKGPVFKKAVEDTILREPLVEKIRQIITPAERSSFYPLIIGEHGTGKTSLIKLAVGGMDENKPKGVVYVNIPLELESPDTVAEAMREALGWSPDQVIDSSTPASLREVLQVLSHLAIKYKQEYRKVPVLIIDNANKLSEKHQKVLNLFQDYAKDAADEGIITVVFMSSEGRVPRRMMERSSWSRHGRIMEVGDVSKEEVLQYLKDREIDKEQAAQIYELVGGRMVHLKSIADDIKRNFTFEDIRQTMFSDAKSQLNSAQVLSDLTYHEEGGKIIRELLKKGSISEKAYVSLVGRVTGAKLLETNVFAFHYNSQEVTFQSTVMQRYCEENSALFKARTWLDW